MTASSNQDYIGATPEHEPHFQALKNNLDFWVYSAIFAGCIFYWQFCIRVFHRIAAVSNGGVVFFQNMAGSGRVQLDGAG